MNDARKGVGMDDRQEGDGGVYLPGRDGFVRARRGHTL